MHAQEIIALSSAFVALAAFFVALRADMRARDLALVQMFLSLRSRFLEIYVKLPDPEKEAASYTADDKAAVLAYWHHTFDEWYVTTKLSNRLMNQLWSGFYAPAIRSGMGHDAYRAVLFESLDDRKEFGEYGPDYREAMKKLWETGQAT